MSLLRRQDSRIRVGLFALFSLLLFCLLCAVVAVFLFAGYYWLFVALAILDGVGIFAKADLIVYLDRSVFFLTVMIISMLQSPLNIFSLTIEILILVAALDFSLFLKKLDCTRVHSSVVLYRLRSYAYTVLPAFLLTYALYLYSFNLPLPKFSLSEIIIVFGLSSVGTLIIVYVLAQGLLSLGKHNVEA